MIQWHTGAGRVRHLTFNPDCRLLASANRRATRVQLWRPDGTPAGRVAVGWPVGAVAFSPDGRHLAVCGAPTDLLLFDTTTRCRATSLYTYGPAVTVAFPP